METLWTQPLWYVFFSLEKRQSEKNLCPSRIWSDPTVDVTDFSKNDICEVYRIPLWSPQKIFNAYSFILFVVIVKIYSKNYAVV